MTLDEECNDNKSFIAEDEIFLATPVMVEEESIEESPQEYEDESSPNSLSNPPASLSLSEDSDTARIYDLHTMQTRFEKRPPPTKALSPDTVKFFAPRNVAKFPKPTETEIVENQEKEVRTQLCLFSFYFSNDIFHLQLQIPAPLSTQENISTVELINRLVIEDDVLPVLPSVKKLASAFASKQADTDLAPIQRPKVILAINIIIIL